MSPVSLLPMSPVQTVFYCSLGHNNEMYWHPTVLRHYLAGIQWALGDYKVEVQGKK